MTRLGEVVPGVLVATSRIDALNSVVVSAGGVGGGDSGGGGALLIDPGWEQDELDELAAELAALQLRPVAGFATHAHHDHVLWHPDFGSVPRWASTDTVYRASTDREELVAVLGTGFRPETLELVGRLTPLTGQGVPWPGPAAAVITHDGHAPGHSALWFAGLGVLVAGDMLSDRELPLLDKAPSALADYRAALDALAPVVAVATIVIPGHGTPGTDAAARLAADRHYLDALARGTIPEDPRLRHPGMTEAHAANVRAAQRQSAGR